MTCNIGKTERILRVIVGLIITSLAFVGPQSPWAYLGLVPVLTGRAGWSNTAVFNRAPDSKPDLADSLVSVP